VVRTIISVSICTLLLGSFASPLSAKKKKKPSPDEGMNLEVSTKQKKKKSDEDITQTLPLPKEAPTAVIGATDRLVFQISPLSNKGLLPQQTRDTLRLLMRPGRSIIKLRAFVAGSGDMRRRAGSAHYNGSVCEAGC
jgi:hypothetical protein